MGSSHQRNSSRRRPAASRPKRKPRRKPAHKPQLPTPETVLRRLEIAMAVARTVADALRHQECEHDDEYSQALLFGCLDPLGDAFDDAELLFDRVKGGAA